MTGAGQRAGVIEAAFLHIAEVTIEALATLA
jgi:hypothetical protein